MYHSEENIKQYQFSSDASFEEMEDILRENNNPNIKSLIFSLNGKNVDKNKHENFLENTLDKEVSIFINSELISSDIDLKDLIYYKNHPKIRNILKNKQIPLFEACNISEFFTNFENNFNKSSINQKRTMNRINANFMESLKVMAEKTKEKKTLSKKFIEDNNQIFEKITSDSVKKSTRFMKYIFYCYGIQWGALFYLTYFKYGWDFCEPLSYLIGLSFETCSIAFFIKYSKSLNNKNLFEGRLGKTKSLIEKKAFKSSFIQADFKFYTNKQALKKYLDKLF